MSRKKSRGTPDALDFRAPRRAPPRAVRLAPEAATLIRDTLERSPATVAAVEQARAAGVSEERIALSLVRAREIHDRVQRPVHAPAPPRTRGRPASTQLDRAVADYLFDVNHWDALRAAGIRNVPPDSMALDATIARHWPADDPNDAALRERRRAALKKAVERRRRAGG